MYRKGLGELNERIAATRAAIAKKARLQRRLGEMASQEATLEHKIEDLAERLAKKREALKRLKGKEQSSLFAVFLGSKAQRLKKKRHELSAAKLRLEQAIADLGELRGHRDEMQRELDGLAHIEDTLSELLDEKMRYILDVGGSEAREIFDLSEEEAALKERIRELNQAIIAGQDARNRLSEVSGALDSARNLARTQILSGFLAITTKYNRVFKIQKLVDEAQWDISAFEREMSDVKIKVHIRLYVADFSKFADQFNDGRIMDWALKQKINDSRASVKTAIGQINDLIDELKEKRRISRDRIAGIEKTRDELVEGFG